MRYLLLLFLVGCGSSGTSEPKPEPITPIVKKVCLSVQVVHIPTNPSDWVYLDELYSITFSSGVAQQQSAFAGTSLSSDTIEIENNVATIDFYVQGEIFTIEADYFGYNNLTVEVQEIHGKFMSYSVEYSNIDMSDCWE